MVLAGLGQQGDGRADIDRQGNFERHHRGDGDHRDCATNQKGRPAARGVVGGGAGDEVIAKKVGIWQILRIRQSRGGGSEQWRVARRQRRSQKRRNQHDVFELVGGQCVAQCRSGRVVGARHADGGKPQASLDRALPGAQNRGDHLFGCAIGGRVRADGEGVFFDDQAVTVWAFDHRHPNRGRCHRNAEYNVQNPSQGFVTGGGLEQNTPKRC